MARRALVQALRSLADKRPASDVQLIVGDLQTAKTILTELTTYVPNPNRAYSSSERDTILRAKKALPVVNQRINDLLSP